MVHCSTGLFKSILRLKTRIIKGILFDLLFDHVFNFRCLSSNYCEKLFSEKFELLRIPKMSQRVSVSNERYVSTDESRVNIDGETNGQVHFQKKSFFELMKMQIKVQKIHTSDLLKVHSYPMNQMSNLRYNLIQISSRLTSRELNKMSRLSIKTMSMLRCMQCLQKLKVVE